MPGYHWGVCLQETTIGRMLGYLAPYRRQAALSYAGMVVIVLGQISVPLLIRATINAGIIHFNERILAFGSVSILIVAFVEAAIRFDRSYWLQYLGERVACDLRAQLLAQILRQPPDADGLDDGELLVRITDDVTNVRTFLATSCRVAVHALLTGLGIIGIMLALDWRLSLVALLPLPCLVLLVFRYSSRLEGAYVQIQAQLDTLITHAQENLVGIRIVRAFVQEETELARFQGMAATLYDRQLQAVLIRTVLSPLTVVLAGLSTAVVLGLGGTMVVDGKLNIGTILAFSLYLGMLADPIQNISWIAGDVARAQASARRIFTVLDAPPKIVSPRHAVAPAPVRGEVTLEDVVFNYSGSGVDVLRGVSLVASPGMQLGLTGPVGSGKSTVMQLLPRFFDVTAGRVTIDGVDVRDWDLYHLRHQIGLVTQETILFSLTVRENIAFAWPDAPLEAVVEAAQQAQAHAFIAQLPQGYETRLDEGVALSGGQRQRLALARALLVNPPILILDDVTSNLDLETDVALREALRTLSYGRTCFLVSQRLTTLRHADRIYVFDEGRIVEQGAPQELLTQSGRYRRLADLQHPEPSGLSEASGAPSERTE